MLHTGITPNTPPEMLQGAWGTSVIGPPFPESDPAGAGTTVCVHDPLDLPIVNRLSVSGNVNNAANPTHYWAKGASLRLAPVSIWRCLALDRCAATAGDVTRALTNIAVTGFTNSRTTMKLNLSATERAGAIPIYVLPNNGGWVYQDVQDHVTQTGIGSASLGLGAVREDPATGALEPIFLQAGAIGGNAENFIQHQMDISGLIKAYLNSRTQPYVGYFFFLAPSGPGGALTIVDNGDFCGSLSGLLDQLLSWGVSFTRSSEGIYYPSGTYVITTLDWAGLGIDSLHIATTGDEFNLDSGLQYDPIEFPAGG